MSKLIEQVVISQTAEISDDLYELLLLADPSSKMINSYLDRGLIFIASLKHDIIGEYILLKTRPNILEVVNIAVREDYQQQGLGKFLLNDAIERARLAGAERLEIGTANSSLFQLALYQKLGFRIVGIDKNYFLRHYNKPLYENKIQCFDMIRLSKKLV